MEQPQKKRGTSKVIILVAVVAVAALVVYSVLTYPQTVVSFPVSFTIGANSEERVFSMPLLHSRAQLEVLVSSGTTLWSASITQQDQVIWEHRATQGDQTLYQSGWIELSSGAYNFTFSTIGFGELLADINVVTKGGFW